jgi:hypothetical protein
MDKKANLHIHMQDKTKDLMEENHKFWMELLKDISILQSVATQKFKPLEGLIRYLETLCPSLP